VPHWLPLGQLGEHAGGAHLPAVQTPERQSPGAPHVAPAGQLGNIFVHFLFRLARAPS